LLVEKTFFFGLAMLLGGLLLRSLLAMPAPTLAQTAAPVFVGAGDIAACNRTGDEATAQLLDEITGTVFTLGDNVYEDGADAEFNDCYEPTWGRHKARTRPVPGNHDYHLAGAAGYYTYYGAAASPLDSNCISDCKGYYSYNLGTWHIIALNSEIAHGASSAQVQWLRDDLAANASKCTLAYWHRPRFSSGRHGGSAGVQPFWQALYEYEADVVLSGHDHTYERFAPQDPSGQADPAGGIRQFVVGTGGAGLYAIGAPVANSEVRNNTAWGVLKLTLYPASYDWVFIPVAGQTFSDAGSANCVGVGPPPTSTYTATLTSTPSPTHTLAATSTSTLTATMTLTGTATSASIPPSHTPTPAPTSTPTSTASDTPTETSTATLPVTDTRTPTATGSPPSGQATPGTPAPGGDSRLQFLPIVRG
jgi:hypothetical protein